MKDFHFFTNMSEMKMRIDQQTIVFIQVRDKKWTDSYSTRQK